MSELIKLQSGVQLNKNKIRIITKIELIRS